MNCFPIYIFIELFLYSYLRTKSPNFFMYITIYLSWLSYNFLLLITRYQVIICSVNLIKTWLFFFFGQIKSPYSNILIPKQTLPKKTFNYQNIAYLKNITIVTVISHSFKCNVDSLLQSMVFKLTKTRPDASMDISSSVKCYLINFYSPFSLLSNFKSRCFNWKYCKIHIWNCFPLLIS